ncbi:MAG TPA: hypothetical protein VF151_10845 [Gemmatimonadales bacterium]
MIPITQRESDDCLQAVVASLLHLPLADVPSFRGENWQANLNRWLAPWGLAYIQVKDFARWAIEFGIAGCHHELTGPSRAERKQLHATVGVDGRLAHDPDPSRAGISAVRYSGIIIALRPWEAVERAGLVLREKAA